MGRFRREEFRQESVRIASTSYLKRRQVVSDLGIAMSTLNKWVTLSLGDLSGLHRRTAHLRQRVNDFDVITVVSRRSGIF